MESTKNWNATQGRTISQQLKLCSRPKTLVKIGVLAAMGFVLMETLHIPLPFAPAFMSVDFGDVPALIGGLGLGPVAGVLIQLVKNILKILTTQTAGVGELSNLIVGTVYVVTASIIYQRRRTLKGAIVGLIVGSLAMTAVAYVSNTFFIFPVYAKVMGGIDLNTLAIQIGSTNSLVTDYTTLMIFAVIPFNLVKCLLASLLTALLYKRISPILHR